MSYVHEVSTKEKKNNVRVSRINEHLFFFECTRGFILCCISLRSTKIRKNKNPNKFASFIRIHKHLNSSDVVSSKSRPQAFHIFLISFCDM